MTDKNTLLEFPCQFPIKIIGNNSSSFLAEIKEIIMKHFPDFDDNNLICKTSKENKYLAISINVLAQNQEMLDDFYREITKHPDIKMAL